LEDAGTHAITVDKPRDYDKARRLAEEIAKFIHCGIRDRSSEIAEVVREAGTFD
jgi:UDP-N-acetylmuramyl tripeptide synthase